MNLRLLSVLPLVAACTASSSPDTDRACTAMGCVDGFHVEVTSSGAWQPGAYVVTVVADGVTTTCSATFPLTASSRAECSGQGVQVGLSGSMLPATAQSISHVALTSAPKSVAVAITRDGVSIASRVYTPTYKTSRPNGPDCEPTCTSATDTLGVTP